MKKNILIAVIAFLTIGIATANARFNIKVKRNKSTIEKISKNGSKIMTAPVLESAFSITETCQNGSVYMTLGLLWRNDDGSITIQTVHQGTECEILPPQP